MDVRKWGVFLLRFQFVVRWLSPSPEVGQHFPSASVSKGCKVVSLIAVNLIDHFLLLCSWFSTPPHVSRLASASTMWSRLTLEWKAFGMAFQAYCLCSIGCPTNGFHSDALTLEKHMHFPEWSHQKIKSRSMHILKADKVINYHREQVICATGIAFNAKAEYRTNVCKENNLQNGCQCQSKGRTVPARVLH